MQGHDETDVALRGTADAATSHSLVVVVVGGRVHDEFPLAAAQGWRGCAFSGASGGGGGDGDGNQRGELRWHIGWAGR
jgi:hypothetical protein